MMVKIQSSTKQKVAQAAVAMQKDSRTISKCKPMIRISHIHAPKIIRTGVANFWELVQRLTGKPTDSKGNISAEKRSVAIKKESRDHVLCVSNPAMKEAGFFKCSSAFGEGVKGYEQILKGDNASGFLGGFEDFDSLVQGFNEFPLLPFSSSNVDVFGDVHYPL